MKKIFEISQFGAKDDGKTLNTAVIQAAIDACHAAGGGTVLCEAGVYLTGALVLKSNVELHLAHGCKLVGSTRQEDYPFFITPGWRPREHKGFLTAANAENIAITGPGEINGSGPAFFDTTEAVLEGCFYKKPPHPRPFMVLFHKCRNLRFEGASFIDSPFYTFWLMQCDDVRVDGITIRADQRMINNDGLDIDACRNVVIANCSFTTCDDCISLRAMREFFDGPGPFVTENVTVTNCIMDTWCAGVRVGCPGDGTIRNCSFSNLVIKARRNGIIFHNPLVYLSPDKQSTGDFHDFVFSNIVIQALTRPIWLYAEEGIRLVRLSDISFSNIRAQGGLPCIVEGSSQTTIRNVQFSDLSVRTTGADALVCRHCEGIRLQNVELANLPA